MSVRPTIMDIARAVERLDENADWADDSKTVKVIDGQQWTGSELVDAVANGIRFNVAGYYGRGSNAASAGLKKVSKGDVVAMLIVLGASTFTVEQHAARITRSIRSNYLAGE